MAILLTVRPRGGLEPRSLTFDQQRVRLGRGAMCDLRLPHRAVSSVHAMILLEGDRYYLIDTGSTNGTTLNGELLVIERRKLLRSGDVIGIADFEVEFRSGVAMVSHHSEERTAAVARLLAQQVLVDDGQALRPPALVVLAGHQEGERFELETEGATLTLGRSDDHDIIIDDREVSRHQLEIDLLPDGVYVRDVGGKNELLINDRPARSCRLKDRDELLVGATVLVFDEPVEAYLRELAQWPDAELVAAPRPSEGPRIISPAPIVPSALELDDEGELLDEAEGERATEIELLPAGAAAQSESDDGGDEERRSPAEAKFPSPSEIGGAVRAKAREWRLDALNTPTAGVEVAILLVGAIVLAICVGALVWIFR